MACCGFVALTCWPVAERCHVRVHAMGTPRITTSIKVATRADREQSIPEKIDSASNRET
ncbi:MAG: thiamine-binding protein [Rubripirellula sp.]|nr:thiamine-binding protein [Rubripirellula sp.]